MTYRDKGCSSQHLRHTGVRVSTAYGERCSPHLVVIRSVGIIGAGAMGSGIAQVCAQTGWEEGKAHLMTAEDFENSELALITRGPLKGINMTEKRSARPLLPPTHTPHLHNKKKKNDNN